jgi:hypothetical protein
MAKDNSPSPPLATWLPLEGLVALAAAGATAWLASLPIIFVPGILAYVLLVLLRLRRFYEAVDEPSVEPLRPDLSALRPEHAARVSRCVTLQSQILGEIRGADAEHRAMLAPSESKVRGLARWAHDLAQRLQKIDAHLGADDLKMALREAQTIERRIVETENASARESLAGALEQHRRKARVIQELRADRERADAQLTRVELTLETVAAQILRIKSADAGVMIEGGPVVESLDALSVEVDSAAEAVDAIAAR